MTNGKRICDLVAGTGLLIISSPVLAVAAITLRTSGIRPLLWRSSRLGRNGQRFSLLMLRTLSAHNVVPASRRLTPASKVVRAFHSIICRCW